MTIIAGLVHAGVTFHVWINQSSSSDNAGHRSRGRHSDEAARWQEQAGAPVWLEGELTAEKIGEEVAAGLFFVAEFEGEPIGTVKFQLEDPLFWPDLPTPDATYVHRLAVRRHYAGKGVSTALLKWAVERTRQLGRRLLRLDCDANRPRLRAVYENFGFRYHSDRRVGRYLVARYEYRVGSERS